TTTADGSGNWSYQTGALGDGPHSFTATATDAAGNVSDPTAALAVTIGTADPWVSLDAFAADSAASGDGLTNDNDLLLTGTAEAGATVSVYDGATLLGTTT